MKPQTSRAMAAIGRRLKALRLEVRPRLTQAVVGKAIGKSQDLVSLIEKGGQLPTDQQLRKMLDLYDVDEATRVDLLAEIREARASEAVWWNEYLAHLPRTLVRLIELEDSASKISIATSGLIPWPFQTRRYMEDVDEFYVRESGIEKTHAQHTVRLRRQDIVLRSDRPVSVNAIFSEAAIRAQVGGPASMKEQLARLIEMADQANVTFRVIPFSAGAAAATQLNINIMDFPAPNDPGVATMDTGTGVTILEDPKEVRARRRMFDYLAGHALSPAGSVDLVSTAIKEL
ncbi:helix-turn-helix transcriptional regulator [Streptomyces sp. FH025]|uniref:helix-turn-helix domain-containing protein n=1 Tax=Streptomyces sp. FH025 TaxID=2815937 RepID=UPI001A9FDC89|nr:helix-turn-helix transcriptional regulator [Streptomyces sp. FH025]MBO1419244.1 helix-turn-helix domain-containing protein [Streptomyces sp. FH025]